MRTLMIFVKFKLTVSYMLHVRTYMFIMLLYVCVDAYA